MRPPITRETFEFEGELVEAEVIHPTVASYVRWHDKPGLALPDGAAQVAEATRWAHERWAERPGDVGVVVPAGALLELIRKARGW